MKVLFLMPYPREGASSRYRVIQFIPYLESRDVTCWVRPFFSSQFYKILYNKNHYFRKSAYFTSSLIKRFFDLFLAARADIVFVHLRAVPLGPPLMEWIIKKIGKKIVYDLDDAIYLGKTSHENQLVQWFKFPRQVDFSLRISTEIISCNEHLSEYAKQRTVAPVTTIHTCVDTDKFKPDTSQIRSEIITIGWVGSHSTAVYLEPLRRIFLRLYDIYNFRIKIVGAGSYRLNMPGLDVSYEQWTLAQDVVSFQSLDIGVYPLADDEWTAGKTGFKTIQYMSVGVPCVVSNVGANKGIVVDGVNGFLASSEDEWVEKLGRLLKDETLRKHLGMSGRKTAEERFSFKVNAPALYDVLYNTKMREPTR
jgi:L-malate glycosyltransferase